MFLNHEAFVYAGYRYLSRLYNPTGHLFYDLDVFYGTKHILWTLFYG